MARYSLIVKDSTYVRLLALASKRGLSMGKFINQILDKTAEEMMKREKA